jgi:osmoprotectant transport system permease protein
MKNKTLALILSVVFAATLLLTGCGGSGDTADTITVTCQTWTESNILGHITQKLLEQNTDYEIERVELESNVLVWEAFKSDQVDIWPGYTSGLFNLFEGDDTVLHEPDEVYDYVSEIAERDYDIVLTERIGFYNNYDLAVTPETAEEYGLETYSDLAEVSNELTIVADANFEDRADCYPLLQESYGMDFKDIYTMSVSPKFIAMENGEADVISCYTTDAGIARLGLKLLNDDKRAMMHFDAVYMVRKEVLEAHPELEDLLNKVKITNDEMAAMNLKVEGEGMSPEEVAQEYLEENDLI